jgi:16S rRNA (adenine(1408)-N(1))-methyltransferase
LVRVVGKTRTPLDDQAFAALRRPFARVLVDLGTGDGAFVLRAARARPDCFCIGLDPVAEAMAQASRRAAAKPRRGGLANALFLLAAVEALPSALEGIADEITVNFPWGSLLRALVVPEAPVLEGIARLARPGGDLTLRLNFSVFRDTDYLARLGLPGLDAARFAAELVPAYRRAGFALSRFAPPSAESLARTSWGQRLVKGAGRDVMEIVGRRL